MRPIELTRVLENGNTKPVWINPAHIVFFVPGSTDGVGARVSLLTATYSVAETPEQIVSRLADHRSSTGVDLGALPIVGADWGPA